MRRRPRLMDVINFVWASVHDFVYAGVMLGIYWLWKQPPAFRNNVLVVAGVAALLIIDAVVNYRQHRKMESQIELLEKQVHRLRTHDDK